MTAIGARKGLPAILNLPRCRPLIVRGQAVKCSSTQAPSTRLRAHCIGNFSNGRGKTAEDSGRTGNRLITPPRAVDNQVFFGTCSPARDLSAGYHAVCRNLFAVSALHKPIANGRRLGLVGSLARSGPNVRICVFKTISSVR